MHVLGAGDSGALEHYREHLRPTLPALLSVGGMTGALSAESMHRVETSGAWLDDTAMEYGLQFVITDRIAPSIGSRPTAKVGAIQNSSMFITRLRERSGFDGTRWGTRSTNTFHADNEFNFFIVHESATHWWLLVVHMATCEFVVWDSWLLRQGRPQTPRDYNDWVAPVHAWLHATLGAAWSFAPRLVLEMTCPQQENYTDCGVFVLMISYLLVRGLDPGSLNLQQSVSGFREHLALAFRVSIAQFAESQSEELRSDALFELHTALAMRASGPERSHVQRFKECLTACGRRLINVVGDGDCMLHAVNATLGEEGQPWIVRRSHLVNMLLQN